MKAISLLQPWATLLVLGIKGTETRSWTTRHRGQLFIHASKGLDPEGERLWDHPKIIDQLNRLDIPKAAFVDLPRGAVIGSVDLEKVVKMDEKLIAQQTPLELLTGLWLPGRYAWLTDSPNSITPIPCKGGLGVWTFKP